VRFDELDSARARELFDSFVKAWNRGKLAPHLYKGLHRAQVAPGALSTHKWKFRLDGAEAAALQEAREEVMDSSETRDAALLAAKPDERRGGRDGDRPGDRDRDRDRDYRERR
jgi:hypothetical protein